jgi:hypothetical protein
MANKHITNPCSMSNKVLPNDTEVLQWPDPVTGTVRVFCPRCNNYVSVNKVNKTLRKHTTKAIFIAPDQSQLVQDFE